MRITPSASVTVTTMGKPSGMAATARLKETDTRDWDEIIRFTLHVQTLYMSGPAWHAAGPPCATTRALQEQTSIECPSC